MQLVMTLAKEDVNIYDSIYESFEKSKCIDWVEALQATQNEEICNLAYQVMKQNSPEGIIGDSSVFVI